MDLLTKEECEEALENIANLELQEYEGLYGRIKYVGDIRFYDYRLLRRLIKEHFDNPPLDFGQFKQNMWIWDIKRKQWMQVYSGSYVMYGEKWLDVYTVGYDEVEDIKYEDDRFYRKECYHE